MNYIKQVNTFYELLPTNPLSANSQCLYNILLHINNKCNWKSEFSVANSLIMGFASFDKNKLDRARNELIQKGYIKYKAGRNQFQAGTYEIIGFEAINYFSSDTALDTANDTALDTANDTASNTASEDINKLNKTKTKLNIKKENKKKKEFVPPAVEDVKKYIVENNLSVDANYFYKYFTTSDWVDKNGNAVKNWKQKLLTWDSYRQPKKASSAEFKNYDYEGDDTL